MKDINFFDDYMKKRKSKVKQFIVILFICILIFIPVVNQYIITIKKQNVAANKITSSQRVSIQNIKNKKLEVNEMKAYYELLKQINAAFDHKEFINDSLIYTINNDLPSNLYLSKITASERKIEINGVAKDTAIIAEFERRLRQKQFEEVFIPSISKLNNSYIFSLTFTLKGCEQNEVN